MTVLGSVQCYKTEDGVLLQILLFLFYSVHLSGAAVHSLQYVYTAVTPNLNSTAVGLLDGEQIVYYDSKTNKMIPRTKWMKKIEAGDPHHWDVQSVHMQNQQEWFQDNLAAVMQSFGHTKGGVHTLKRMYGCDVGENGTTRGHYQYTIDNDNFFSLDLKTGLWAADNNKAEQFIKVWDPDRKNAQFWKDFLEDQCTEWLRKYLINDLQSRQHKARGSDAAPAGGSGGGLGVGSGGGIGVGSGGMQLSVIDAVFGLFLFFIVV